MEFDNYVSTVVSHQFPQFYQAEGPQFVAFVKAYYEWMEQSGYALDASSSLLDYRDIDATIDQFIDSFKTEFLANFPAITSANKQIMVKRIKDFYEAKGSKQGMQLLFRLLFADDISIYDPGTDILKASDGVWKLPKYIEVEHNPRSREFIGYQVTGSQSGAMAFVESVRTTVINKRMIDVLTVSSIQGNFEYGELITQDGDLYNAPKVIGSLTAINITDGGANNKVGDIFEIIASTNGKKGIAKVTATTDGTGRVTFKLLDGGTGYSLANDQVKISNSVLFVSNRTTTNVVTSYDQFEFLYQPLTSVSYFVSTPTDPLANTLYQFAVKGYSGSTPVANGYVVLANTAGNNIIINVTGGNFSLADSIKTTGNAVSFTGYTLANASAKGIITGSNSLAVGVHSVVNKFYGNGAFVTSSTNTYVITANVDTISTGNGASFSIGSLLDTEVVTLYTDLLSSNNINGVEWMNMLVSGANSNTGLFLGTGGITANSSTNIVTGVTSDFTNEIQSGSGIYNSSNVYLGAVNTVTNSTSLILTGNALANVSTAAFYYNLGQYGFPKNYAAGYGSLIADALNVNTFTIGTIASLSAINPGSNYNTNPFVAVRNDYVAAFNRRNIIIELNNRIGSFAIGDNVTQTYTTPTEAIALDTITGGFVVGEGVTQSNGTANAYGTILSVGTNEISIGNIFGDFYANSSGGQNIRGITSTAQANVTAVSGTTTTAIAKGEIVSFPSATSIEIVRKSFSESFQTGSLIYTASGGSASVVNVTQNMDSPAMGFNAEVSANVSIARGIATSLQIIESGYGHQPGDTLELLNNSNPFAITGIANVLYQGKASGYWDDNRGKLNSDKYLIDSEYYQDFSYEVQSRLSMDKYADILKRLAHAVGTKMFGKVTINSNKSINMRPIPASLGYENHYMVVDRNDAMILDRTNQPVITRY